MSTLPDAWIGARRKLIKALRRPDRDRFDALVLGLIGPSPSLDGLLRIGVGTATALAKEAPPDPELLAAAVALPWYDSALLGTRGRLLYPPRPLDWTTAMLLAMAPAGERTTSPSTPPTVQRAAYLRQLAALPPLLRATVLIERHLAAATPIGPGLPLGAAWPFDAAEQAGVAQGIPRRLLPPLSGFSQALPPPPPPVGSPAEAIELVRERKDERFGSYRMRVEGDPGFAVEAVELVYRVRWDVPPEAIVTVGQPRVNPGDREAVRFREPGWIVDRATREVAVVDLASAATESYVGNRRVFPLPPGWLPEGRGLVPDGLALLFPTADAAPVPADAAPVPAGGAALPAGGLSAGAALGSVLGEATARYAEQLSTETWPDFLVAARVGAETMRELLATGHTHPDLLTAALLGAQGTARTDTLVDEASALWQTPAGEHARAARPEPDETDGAGAARRATRLADASAEVRTLAVANARARATVETALFGATPEARTAELSTLTPLLH